jgi:hypothetical protein
VLELDPEDLRAIDALIKLYLDLSRWSELLGVYQRKVDLVVDPDEKKRIFYQVGAVYERELGDVAAPSTPTSACSSSIRTICRPSGGSTSSTRRRRTGPSC